ncbi:MAG: DUF362 domain-containing protein [Proteobacteria bacterium]|nr:DUF362 domain-containing protein [Pseudomonadota bacterium]
MVREDAVDINLAMKMVNEGVCHVTGNSLPSGAWRELFHPKDTVGIKVNCLGGKGVSTHPELVMAVVEGLRIAGVPDSNIIIWDRLTSELESLGFKINRQGEGVRCFGTDSTYEPNVEEVGAVGSCFSSILSRQCTALINMPVLKDHDLSGVSLSLKNLYGAIHNPNKYHDNNGNPYIADLNSHPLIRKKVRLIICDGITGMYNGGPGFKPQGSWPFQGIILSRDPVALDRVGCEIIEAKRKEKGLPGLKEVGRDPKHIRTAFKKGLGIGDMKRIEVVKG